MSKLEVGETTEQFVERLNRHIVKRCEMAGYEDNYDGLKSLIICDQFFITCDRQLQTFLKEKGKLSLKEMAIYVSAQTLPQLMLTQQQT